MGATGRALGVLAVGVKAIHAVIEDATGTESVQVVHSLSGESSPHVILHIGTEKTGSTAIQNYLAANKELFLSNGIAPLGEFILKDTFNNLALTLAAKENAGDDIGQYRRDSFQEFRCRVRQEIISVTEDLARSDGSTVICSSEHLSSRLIEREDVESLRELFPANCSFGVVVYLRRQDQLLLGMQAEGIKAGASSLRVPRADELDPGRPYGIRYFDYEKLLEPWEYVFGRDAITVRVYDTNDLQFGDVISDFVATIGLSASMIAGGRESDEPNSRLSPESLWFLAQINPHISANARARICNLLVRDDPFPRGSLLRLSELAEFYGNFADSNARVAMKYLGRKTLFDEGKMELREYTSPRTMPNDEFIRLVAHVVNLLAG